MYLIFDKNNLIFQRHLARYVFVKDFVKNKNVISVACGVGYGEYILATEGHAREITGVDYDREVIEYAKENYKNRNLNFVRTDARDLSNFKNNYYEVVVSLETIEHLDDDNSFLRELKRILKPGGILLISTPNKAYSYKSLFRKRPFEPSHVREYHKSQFISLLGKHFDDIRLYGQKIILKRSILNLPRYLIYKLSKKLIKLEQDESGIKPYPDDRRLSSCYFLAFCRKR